MPRPVPPSSSVNGAGQQPVRRSRPRPRVAAPSSRPRRGPSPGSRSRDPRRSARGDEVDATPSGRPRPVYPPDRASRPAARHDTRARKRAEANAQRLLGQMLARRYGALITLAVVAGLLLALSWVGLALRDALGARQSAQRQQAASVAALGHARAEIQALSVQRDQAAAAAIGAQRDQVSTRTRQAPPASKSQLTRPHQQRR